MLCGGVWQGCSALPPAPLRTFGSRPKVCAGGKNFGRVCAEKLVYIREKSLKNGRKTAKIGKKDAFLPQKPARWAKQGGRVFYCVKPRPEKLFGARLQFKNFLFVVILGSGSFLFLFGTAFVVDDGERRLVDERNALLFGDLHHLRERGFEEYAGDLGQLCARLLGELYVRIDAFRRIDDRLHVSLLRLDLFGDGLFELRVPKIRTVAVAVIDGHAREPVRFHAVDDGAVIFLFHAYFIDFEDKMRAEFARYAVEIAVGRLVPLQIARLVEVRVFEGIVPRALENLERLL